MNDRHGHPAGDQLLQQVADRLLGTIRKDDLAGRLGGDEFVIFQTGIRHPSEAELMARRRVRALRAVRRRWHATQCRRQCRLCLGA